MAAHLILQLTDISNSYWEELCVCNVKINYSYPTMLVSWYNIHVFVLFLIEKRHFHEAYCPQQCFHGIIIKIFSIKVEKQCFT